MAPKYESIKEVATVLNMLEEKGLLNPVPTYWKVSLPPMTQKEYLLTHAYKIVPHLEWEYSEDDEGYPTWTEPHIMWQNRHDDPNKMFWHWGAIEYDGSTVPKGFVSTSCQGKWALPNDPSYFEDEELEYDESLEYEED